MDSERVRGATKSATHSQLAYQVAGTQQLPPVGSSSKDRRWARRAGPTGASRFRPTPSDAADGRRKKVEGSPLMLQEQHAALPPFGKQATAPSISRIPLGPRAPNAIDSVQQQQVTASRIPRPPQAAAARLESPGLAAVLDTPNAPGGLSEMQPQQLQAPGSTPPVLPVAAFHTYNNPSFDGATEFLVASPDENNPAAAAGAAAPDIRQQPPSSRTVTTSVDGVAHNTAAVATAAPSPPGPLDASSRQREGTAGQVTATTPGGGLPTPEAWQLLQHLNQDSPAPESDSARGESLSLTRL